MGSGSINFTLPKVVEHKDSKSICSHSYIPEHAQHFQEPETGARAPMGVAA